MFRKERKNQQHDNKKTVSSSCGHKTLHLDAREDRKWLYEERQRFRQNASLNRASDFQRKKSHQKLQSILVNKNWHWKKYSSIPPFPWRHTSRISREGEGRETNRYFLSRFVYLTQNRFDDLVSSFSSTARRA